MKSSFSVAASIILACLFWSVPVGGQEVGDRVVATANFATKYKKEDVGKVFEGGIHTISRVDGKWCMLDSIEGWLPLQYLMDLSDAKEYFSKRIEVNGQDSIAYAHRGMVSRESGDLVSAFTDLDRSLAINRNNPVVWMNRGVVLQAQGKFLLAARDFNEAIRINPKLANAHFNIGLAFYALSDFEQAIAGYDKAIELKGSDPIWFVSRGSAKLNAGDFPGAEKDYRSGLQLNPRLSDAYVGLCNLALLRNDFETAFKDA